MYSTPMAQPPASLTQRVPLAQLTSRVKHMCPCREAAGQDTGPSTSANAKKDQKNQGLYFDYEPVDPETHKRMPIEKEKIREEFSWVRQARNPQADTKPAPKRASAPSRRVRTAQKPVGAQVAVAPPAAAQPAATTSAAGRQWQPAAAQPAASQAATAEPVSVEVNNTTPTAAKTAAVAPAATEAALLPSATAQLPSAAAQGTRPPPTAATSNTSTSTLQSIAPASSSDKAQVLDLTSKYTARPAGSLTGDEQARPLSRKGALLARLSRPAGSTAAQPSTSSSPVAQPEATSTLPLPSAGTAAQPAAGPVMLAAAAAAVSSAAVAGGALASSQPLAGLSLGLPTLPAGATEEEKEALAVLEQFALLDADEVRAIQGLDLEAVSAQDASEQAAFSAWLGQVQQQQQQGPGKAVEGQQQQAVDAQDDAEQLAAAAAVESQVSQILSRGSHELQAFQHLLGALADDPRGTEDVEADPGDADMSEEQLLAQLRVSDPDLYTLLAPGDGLDYGPEEEELEAALDSMQRLGLAGDESVDDTLDPLGPNGGLSTSYAAALGVSDGVEGGVGGVGEDDEEGLMSDAELAELARGDADLAKLLGENSLGRNFERMLEEEGLDEGLEEEEGMPESGAELADLFDAIDEDPDLDDADRDRAKFELQSMFNLGGAQPEDRPLAPATTEGAPARGLTTTGRLAARTGEAPVPELLARPRPRQ